MPLNLPDCRVGHVTNVSTMSGPTDTAELTHLARQPFNSWQCPDCGRWVPLRYMTPYVPRP